MAEHRVADRAGRVVEVHVDPVATGVCELGLESHGAVVERDVVAELVEAHPHLGRAARDADRTTAGELRDLARR